jgi:hypothetical protein
VVTISQAPPPDTTPPTTTIACNSAPCQTSAYGGPVTVALTATDNTGGSGVAATRYTLDGSDPTTTSTAYTTPLTLTQTTTVNYRSWDNAGNAETTHTTLVTITQPDTTAPTVAITTPKNGALVTGSVRIEASASDTGSGVARVEFYVDGKLLATATAVPYRCTWNTRKVQRGTHTIQAIAYDKAGNKATASISVTV